MKRHRERTAVRGKRFLGNSGTQEDPALPGRLRNLIFIHLDSVPPAGSAPDIDFVGTVRWLHLSRGRTGMNQVQRKGWIKPTMPTKASAP